MSRRIEREAGSTYRVNGREVRARDVQLLFADASTGARSTAMVRQGQIGEIIAAKPQERRRILEEAAGIAGLAFPPPRSRAASQGGRGQSHAASTIFCSRSTARPKVSRNRRARRPATAGLRPRSGATKRCWPSFIRAEAARALQSAESKLEADLRDVAEKTRAQAEAARLQAIAAHELPQLRDTEAEAGSELQRLVLARETLDGEERRAKSRTSRAGAPDRANGKRYRAGNRADRGRGLRSRTA